MFDKFARAVTDWTGTPLATALAFGIVVAWLAFAPMFNFSTDYQIIINTGTTIITFLMVFLIQHTQNRDAKATHIKLDELLKGVKGARTSMVGLEDLSDEELESLHNDFKQLHEKYASELQKRGKTV